jgi:Rieske Fe-S protein
MNRRRFLALATTATVCTAVGCPLIADPGSAGGVLDVGPVSSYGHDGVYDAYRSLGCFIVRRGGELFALSSICTHRHVQLKAEPDQSFYCRRHGSTFDPNGHVTKGPAKQDLPRLATSVNAAGHLLVHL